MTTQKEKIQHLLQKCFTLKEWTFLVMDPAFTKLADGAETLDDVETVSKRGAVILLEAEFPRRTRVHDSEKGTESGAAMP